MQKKYISDAIYFGLRVHSWLWYPSGIFLEPSFQIITSIRIPARVLQDQGTAKQRPLGDSCQKWSPGLEGQYE